MIDPTLFYKADQILQGVDKSTENEYGLNGTNFSGIDNLGIMFEDMFSGEKKTVGDYAMDIGSILMPGTGLAQYRSRQIDKGIMDKLFKVKTDLRRVSNAPEPFIGTKAGSFGDLTKNSTRVLNANMLGRIENRDTINNTINGAIQTIMSGASSLGAFDSKEKTIPSTTTLNPKTPSTKDVTFDDTIPEMAGPPTKSSIFEIGNVFPQESSISLGNERDLTQPWYAKLRRGASNSGSSEAIEAEGGEVDIEFNEDYEVVKTTPIVGASHEQGGVKRVLPKNHIILNRSQQQQLANGTPLYQLIQSVPDVNDDDMAAQGLVNGEPLTYEDSIFQGLKPGNKNTTNAQPGNPAVNMPSFQYRKTVAEVKRKMQEEKKKQASQQTANNKPEPPHHGFISGISDFISNPGRYTFKVATALDRLTNPPGPIKVPAGYSYDSKTNKVYPIGSVTATATPDATATAVPPVDAPVDPANPTPPNATKAGDFGNTKFNGLAQRFGETMGYPTGLGEGKKVAAAKVEPEKDSADEQDNRSWFKRLIDRVGSMQPEDYTLIANEVGNMLSMLQKDPERLVVPDATVGDTTLYTPKKISAEPYLNNLNRSYNSLLNFYKQTGKDTTGLTSWLKESQDKILQGVEGKNAEMENNAVAINTQAQNQKVLTQAGLDSRKNEMQLTADMKWKELIGAKDVARAQAVAKSIFDIGQHKQALEDKLFSDQVRAKILAMSFG